MYGPFDNVVRKYGRHCRGLKEPPLLRADRNCAKHRSPIVLGCEVFVADGGVFLGDPQFFAGPGFQSFDGNLPFAKLFRVFGKSKPPFAADAPRNAA